MEKKRKVWLELSLWPNFLIIFSLEISYFFYIFATKFKK